MKKGKQNRLPGCLAALLGCILCFGLLCLACRFRHFTSPEEFTEAGYKLAFPVPENASEIRLAGRKLLFGQQYLCAFTLPEADAHLFMKQYCPAEADALRTAAEYAAEDGEGSPLSSGASFRQVTDRNIADAKILFYEPYQSGSRSRGILVFPDTSEFITFLYISR